jgi:phosphoribosylformylglycinamidine (FGAM) synthase-like enzyme
LLAEILQSQKYLFSNTQWSEHILIKVQKHFEKIANTRPNVIMGPKEDAGIAYFTEFNGEKYGIVISHESHNLHRRLCHMRAQRLELAAM